MHNYLKFDKRFFCDLWRLLKPYWTSEEKISAWGLLFLNILCVLGEVRASIGMNHFHKIFYDALQDFDKNGIIASLEYILVVSLLLMLATSGAIYFNGLLSIRWRRWLTNHYLQRWLDRQSHMHALNQHIDNPDQRVSEDLDKFPSATLSLFFGPSKLLHSILILISFGYILWDLSKSFSFHLLHAVWVIPGFLLWIALFYAIIGTRIISWIGKKLAMLDYQQQHYNADFRYNLVKLREGQKVSGEKLNSEKFHGLFSLIYNNFITIISLKTRLALFTKVYGSLSYIIGFAVAIPFYLAKAFQLGTVTQISSAYNSVISAFSVFMESFTELAEWRSIIHRLAELNQSIEVLHEPIGIASPLTGEAEHDQNDKNFNHV